MSEIDEEELAFQTIFETVRRFKGFDGASYKPNYLKRRLAIRMRAVGTTLYSDYLSVLRNEPKELQLLMDRLTVHVTEFFRDPEVFQAVEESLFPLLDKTFGFETWNAWSAGCSTGEEAYSISIALREWRELHGGGDFKVTASDIDPSSLLTAGKGVYPSETIDKISEERKKRWFLRSSRRVEVAPEIRHKINFEVRDLTMGWGSNGASYHLVFCRNLLIYLTPVEHQLLYERFAKVIKPCGYLVLGRTEALLGQGRMHFRCVDTKNRLYQRLDSSGF
jgi:chemotaxis methyl-accepting protein methylase